MLPWRLMGDDTASDDELMGRYAATGERVSFEQLFMRYAGRLHAYFVRNLGPGPHAQDLVQQTFLHVHRARRDFRQGAPFRPWVYTIAANLRRQHVRRALRKPEAQLDPERHPEPSVSPQASSATDRAVRRALDSLSESQREVVVLHWYQELSFPEVAQVVGASTSAVKVRAHRAYKKLRDILGEAA